jgi:serine phosphatase RsbU (regulator of sigma subunit)/anti-sigma regulatory factor (Ser/Thr protein kinase)
MDFGAIFEALPTAYLVLDADLRLVGANAAYRRNSGLSGDRAELGRHIFELFPANPGDSEGERRLQAISTSMQKARDSRQPDAMDVIRYDIPDGAGGFVQRFWSVIHAPVPGEDGRTAYVLQRNEDVTDFIRDRDRAAQEQVRGEHWREVAAATEADLFSRGQELATARDAEARTALRLAAIAQVVLALAGTTSLQELIDVVAADGLGAVEADTAVLGVLDGQDRLRGTFASRVSGRQQGALGELVMDGASPASEAARTGRRIALLSESASRMHSAEAAEIVDQWGLQATVALPLLVGDRSLGSLTINWLRPPDLGDADLELLTVLASQCAQALEHIQTREAEREAARAASRLAETMQRNLLTEPADPAGLDVAVRYQPAARELQVGGDWYDAFTLRSGETLLVVGDVAGHDQEAAAVMAQVRNVLRGVAHVLGGAPSEVLTALDRALVDLSVQGLATAVIATVGGGDDDGGRVLCWSNAGHPPPVLIEADGTARLLGDIPDLLLGLDPETDRAEHRLEVAAGCTVLLYTDGLIERRGASLDDGLAWLVGACGELADLPADRFCDELLALLPADVEDDVALLAVHVLPGAGDELVLPRDPASVPVARDHVRTACRAASMAADVCDSAVLMASEVVTNAVIHGRGRVRLQVTAERDRVVVEVADDSIATPAVRHAGEDATGGRGMAIVELLADAWGTRPTTSGKVVWFALTA